MAKRARTKYNIEDVTIQMAYSNYSNIARKIVTVTSNETNPEFKQLYKKCLHQYVLLKYDFEYLNSMLIFKGDLDEASRRASTRLQTCINYFYYSPKEAADVFEQGAGSKCSIEDVTNIEEFSYYFGAINASAMTELSWINWLNEVRTEQDHCSQTLMVSTFRVTPQPGVPPEEAGVAVAAESSTGTWTTIWTDGLTNLDRYKGQCYCIERVVGEKDQYIAYVAYPLDFLKKVPLPITI
ncbi:hypothetical protein H5410_022833 [Solanum commersonii]|uniref:Ribulose bisphosphate carboxylase large chain n=1 Tax=Solanum commersonii TaxID=4109 RepID=A0A9J5ZI82_SOLCO|nr:hypothetical protein H5410_022833 [Solanum commersonii]